MPLSPSSRSQINAKLREKLKNLIPISANYQRHHMQKKKKKTKPEDVFINFFKDNTFLRYSNPKNTHFL